MNSTWEISFSTSSSPSIVFESCNVLAWRLFVLYQLYYITNARIFCVSKLYTFLYRHTHDWMNLFLFAICNQAAAWIFALVLFKFFMAFVILACTFQRWALESAILFIFSNFSQNVRWFYTITTGSSICYTPGVCIGITCTLHQHEMNGGAMDQTHTRIYAIQWLCAVHGSYVRCFHEMRARWIDVFHSCGSSILPHSRNKFKIKYVMFYLCLYTQKTQLQIHMQKECILDNLRLKT